MRLLYAKSASPHHGFAAYYTYVERSSTPTRSSTSARTAPLSSCRASRSAWRAVLPRPPDPVLPNLYYYAANNPSEATIAKRRSYAATISYLTPPAENAGLYKGLKEIGEEIGSYQGLRESGRGATIVNSIVATAYTCNLDKDVELPAPEDDAANLTLEERDAIIGKVYQKIMEIESRLLPCGCTPSACRPPQRRPSPPSSTSRRSTAEDGIKACCACSPSRGGHREVYRNNDAGVLAADLAPDHRGRARCRARVGRALDRRRGRVTRSTVMGLGAMFRRLADAKALPTGFDADDELSPLFEYCEFCLKQVVADNEMGALEGLDGQFISPAGRRPDPQPGGAADGPNMHALDPHIPTTAATAPRSPTARPPGAGQRRAYPESIAFVLWGTDNIKTYGESLAQVLWMVGVRPLPDSLGRSTRSSRSCSRSSAGHVDVVVTCSGVFRDPSSTR